MEYEVVIGLEVHSELSTKSKIYCNCSTEFGKDPNTHVCPICLAMPGVLPVLNKKVVEYGVKAGLALNCDIAPYSKQDRKSYFYPDLPKAFQTSQLDEPLCIGGYIDINVDGVDKRINLTRIHIEEDAGKLMHDEWNTGSLVDLNRGGVPLIEIVTEPDIRSSAEAQAFLEKLKSVLEYLEVSDCKMEQGSLRADVNVSVRPVGQEKFGTRTEMKNINSFKAIVRAIEYEKQRHIDILEEGGQVLQETRRWDDAKGCSYSMRSKEDAVDYRYFPEPDLAPIIVDEEWLSEIRATIPELPEQRKKRYISEYELPEYDSSILTASKYLSDLFQEAVDCGTQPKLAANWIMGEIMRITNDKNIEYSEIPFDGKALNELIDLINQSKINNNIAKKVLVEMFVSELSPADIVKRDNLEMSNDDGAIREIVIKVIQNNPQSVADFKSGKEKAIGFLVGQTMKEAKGKANPQSVNTILREELAKI